jgi:hypothetical protein
MLRLPTRPSARGSIQLGLLARLALAGGVLGGSSLLVAHSGQPRAVEPQADGAEGRAVRLERALETISADEISADLHFIASDELGGRDTPSLGLRVAARYIRARLQRLGFEPGAPGGSYFYEYPLDYKPLDLDACQVRWTAGEAAGNWRPGSEYFFGSFGDGAALSLSGGVVFCGTGRSEDFGPEVAEKWALCLDDGKGRGRRGRTAESRGAAGLLTFPAADYPDEPYDQRFAAAMSNLANGRVSYPGAPGEPRAVFPQLFLTREAGLALLQHSPARPADVSAEEWQPALGTDLAIELREQRALAAVDGRITLENVCGLWRGRHPELSKEVILVSAHYDHVGTQGDKIFNGADDNGSGTCGLLALAEALATYGPLDRSVLLIWVSGEEKGLFGSKAWAENPWLPEGLRPAANINIDMIGRNAPQQLLYTPTAKLAEYYNDLAQVTEANAGAEGFTELGSADDYYFRSDQASFETLGIPVMFLFTDVHQDYHQETDEADKIDYDKARRVVRLVLRMLVDLEDDRLER